MIQSENTADALIKIYLLIFPIIAINALHLINKYKSDFCINLICLLHKLIS